jgi:peroxiredoxin
VLIVLILPWVITGLGCWIGYQLVKQNGRILLRMQSLEQQLGELRLSLTTAPPAAPAMPAGLPLGSTAPAFELPDLSGRTRKLSEWRGRRILLIFFNPGCGFCVQMAPDIAALPTKGIEGGFSLLLVSTGGLSENKKLLDEHGIRCPVLLQKQMEVASTYNVSGTPIGYVIDEQGKIASEMAVGAPGLLALVVSAPQPGVNGSGHASSKGNRDLSKSGIRRDGLPLGTFAPEFRLPRLDGGELALKDFRGQQVLLVFSDPACGPCQELAPKLNAMYSDNPDIQVITISRGDREANRLKAAEQKLKFPIVLQRQWEISRLYGMFATPVGYLIDEQGIILANVAVGTEPIVALLSGAATRAKAISESR